MTHRDNAAEHEASEAPEREEQNIADVPNNDGAQRPAPDIDESDRAASEESRRIAAAQDTEL
ncbi:MAG: hypothetical protein RI885_1043 [Actinomycetota bacterium]|jgi:hypothetical protein